MTLPGFVAAFLSGQVVSAALHHQDWLRAVKGHAATIHKDAEEAVVTEANSTEPSASDTDDDMEVCVLGTDDGFTLNTAVILPTKSRTFDEVKHSRPLEIPARDLNGDSTAVKEDLHNFAKIEAQRSAHRFFKDIRAVINKHSRKATGLIPPLGERLRNGGLHLVRVQVVEGEVAPVIEDQELALVLTWTKQVFAETGAAPDHLPELDLALHRLGEDKIHHLGDVDARVQHVYRDCYAQVTFRLLELVDQLPGPRLLGVDDTAELTGELRVHLIEQVSQQSGVVNVAGEDDALAGQLAVGVAQAVVHQVTQDDAVGVLVEHGVVNFLSVELQGIGVDSLILKLSNLFVREVCGLDAFTQELGGVSNDAERHQLSVSDGLLQRVVGRGQLVVAPEQPTGAAADHLDWRGRQAHLNGIEIFEEVAVQVVDGAMGFVSNDQVEESNVERLVVVDQALVDTDVDACVHLAHVVGLADDIDGFLDEIVERVLGLFSQLLAVAQEAFADQSAHLYCVSSLDDLAALFAATDAHAQAVRDKIAAAVGDDHSALRAQLTESLKEHVSSADWDASELYNGSRRIEPEVSDVELTDYSVHESSLNVWKVENEPGAWVVELTASVTVDVTVSVQFFVWDSIDREELAFGHDSFTFSQEVEVEAFLTCHSVKLEVAPELWEIEVEIGSGKYSLEAAEVEPDFSDHD